MSDINGGETFADGQTLSGERLNNHVNEAVIQPDFVGTKSIVPPVGGDHLLALQASTGQLRRVTVQGVAQVGGNVSSVGLDMPSTFEVTGSPVTGAGTLTADWIPGNANKVMATPADGSMGKIALRARDPRDVRFASVTVPAAVIDWSQADKFARALVANTPFTFTNVTNGAEIVVAIQHNSHLAHWPATVHWPDGEEPAPSAAATLFRFMNIAGVLYGYVEAENLRL